MMSKQKGPLPLSAADFHILLVLAQSELYGYAILKAVKEESGGYVRPDLGALYRALARLSSAGLVREAAAPPDTPPAPGQKRRYFGLTNLGRTTLTDEVGRLNAVLGLAGERLDLSLSGSGLESALEAGKSQR